MAGVTMDIWIRYIAVTASAWMAYTNANADTIKGSVWDAAIGTPIEFVKVSVDSLHSTFTGPDGSFVLNTDGSPTRIVDIRNLSRPKRIRETWILDRVGRSLADGKAWLDPVGKAVNSARTATGIFFGAEGAPGRPDAIGLAKAASVQATNALTFRKAGYVQISKVVDGSPNDLVIRMTQAPTDTSIGLHPFLYAGEFQRKSMTDQKIYLVRDGKITWTYNMPGPAEYGDASLLSDGAILFSRGEMGAALISRDQKILWTFQTRGGGAQVHTAQPIGTDRVFLIENGNPPKAMIWNTRTNVKEWEMTLKTGNQTIFHSQFRHCRILKNGNVLLAHMDMGKVSEYDTASKTEIWTCPAPSAWAAVRLKNGNTLVSGNGNGWVREIDPGCKTVWEVGRNDLPGITLGTVQECSRLMNGNTLICSWNGGGTGGAQVIEVTREKRVVWATRAWANPDLGPASSLELLDEPGLMENGDHQR